MAGHRRQRGQAIILIALTMTVLLAMAAIAIDVSATMSDRRALQGAADGAALAGVRSSAQGTDAAHWVAMQYLGRDLGFGLPAGLCVSTIVCPAGTYTIGDYTISLQDSGQALDVSIQHLEPSFFARAVGFSPIRGGASGRAVPQIPLTLAVGYALAALSGDARINGGGTSNPSGDVGGPVYVQGSFGSNNGAHAPQVPTTAYGWDGTQCPGPTANHVDLGGTSDSLSYVWSPSGSSGTQSTNVTPRISVGSAPTTSGPRYTTVAAAKDALGRWQPGIYDGVFPSGGQLNPGVFDIVNVTRTIALGAATNAIPPVGGVVDPTGAVVIVLDGTDTGTLDISSVVLDGIDYAAGAGTDAEGTHNFVIYGQAFAGGISIGSQAATSLTGVVYLPNSTITISGSANPVFTGSVVSASVGLNGGGSGTQTFRWVCGLQSLDAVHHQGGLVR